MAKTGEDVLLNHVTCDVIKFYKEYGYETVDMDGNPADFIGQQLRFAEYLTACGLKGSMDESEASRAVAKFEEQFLTDTIHTILLALKKVRRSRFHNLSFREDHLLRLLRLGFGTSAGRPDGRRKIAEKIGLLHVEQAA